MNPARSLAVAWFAGGWALKQVWLFWVAPIIGAVIAGALYRTLTDEGIERPRQAEARVEARARA